MGSEFARKLRCFTEESRDAGRRDIQDALGDLGDVIVEAFQSDIDKLSLDRSAARGAVEDAEVAALLLDACHIIESRLLRERESRCFQEFKLPRARAFGSLRRFLDDEVRSAVGDQPFVYVAWKRSPEAYLYVGKSQNNDGKAKRLDLDTRGKLYAALEHATLLTLMLPCPKSASIALDVEAAILRVLDDRGRFPKANDRAEKVPGAVGAAHLGQVGQLLCELGAKFQPTKPRITNVVD